MPEDFVRGTNRPSDWAPAFNMQKRPKETLPTPKKKITRGRYEALKKMRGR